MQRQVMFWIAALVVAVFLLWLLSGMLLPFVAGMIIAYLLDPVAGRLERSGLNRLAATSFILVIFVLLLVFGLVLLVPLLGKQISAFAQDLPDYISAFQRMIVENTQSLLRIFGVSEEELRQSMGGLVGQGASWVASLVQSILSGWQAVLNLFSLLIVTPVIAFYLLLDWDGMITAVDRVLPRKHAETIRGLAREIDQVISGFIRGQGTICVILGTFYALGLTAIGLDFGLLIGLFAGFVSFIPYVGTVLGFIASTGVALFQFWPDWPWVAAVIGIFAVGQFAESNVLQPKLVGSYVRLHPVWLIFALFAFGSLFGFVGVLLAVPVAAAIGVLIRFAVRRYQQSSLYFGGENRTLHLPGESDADSAGSVETRG